jgi:hypothetical protein
MKHFLGFALAALCAGTALSPAQALVIGTADSSNSIPFGGNLGGYYYQQIYNASSFGSGMDISKLSFYTSQAPGGAARSGTFVLYLSTISADIATFDTNTSAPWLDSSFVEVFNGSLPSISGNRLDLTLSSVFNYNPASGSLLLTVREFSLSSGTAFFDVDQNNGTTNSRFSAYPYNWNQGLVTGFNDGVAAVPEPASWAMMIGGLALVGGLARRRHATIRFA